MVDQRLTPEDRKALGMAALTAVVTGVVGGLITWAFEEAKRALAMRREKPPPDP